MRPKLQVDPVQVRGLKLRFAIANTCLAKFVPRDRKLLPIGGESELLERVIAAHQAVASHRLGG